MSMDYPSNPLPTIFAEPVETSRRGGGRVEEGSLVISRSMIATISAILIGIFAALAFMFYSQTKDLKKTVTANAETLKTVTEQKDKAIALATDLDNKVGKYASIEGVLARSDELAVKIQEQLDGKPGYKGAAKVKELIKTPYWREPVEATLNKRYADMETAYAAIKAYQPTRVIGGVGSLPEGGMRPVGQ